MSENGLSSRYIVVSSASEVLFRSDEKDDITRYIQGKAPERVSIYQRRYVSESSLMNVQYEDELFLTAPNDKESA